MYEHLFGVISTPPPEKRYKPIFKAQIARRLIKCGNVVYDIKADPVNHLKTIFYFEITDKFISDLKEILQGLSN